MKIYVGNMSYDTTEDSIMTATFKVLTASLCLLILATMPARAVIIAENLGGSPGVVFSNFAGQSFTTGATAEYSNISFNFYNSSNVAFALGDQTYLLLSSEYLGRNDGLSTALSSHIASTTGVSPSGNQWVFNPSLRLNGNTKYWLYGTGDHVPTQFRVGLGDPYSGGEAYHSGAGPGNVFSLQAGNDLRFTIHATPLVNLDSFLKVKADYDTPDVLGPVSFGLTELPDAPSASFFLGDGTPAGGGATMYGLGDVTAASFIIGDGVFTTLTAFSMEVDAGGTATALSYAFAPQDTPTVLDPMIMNFPLTITGMDIASGDPFSYTYANSTVTLTAVPEPSTLGLCAFLGLAVVARRGRRSSRRRKGDTAKKRCSLCLQV